MNTFFDYDKIECVTIGSAKLQYPGLDWNKIEKRFSWGMGDNQQVPVMTLADLNFCLKCHKLGTDINEYNYSEVVHCSVCRKVLLPDDEAYSDFNSHLGLDVICGDHAQFIESEDMYIKKIF